MKKISLLLAMFALSIFSMSAQCVLRYTPSSGEGQSYTSLDQAYADAQDDDILYLSGHTFQFSTNAVEKRLQWVGAGIISDSTYATGSTRINPPTTLQYPLSYTHRRAVPASPVSISEDSV
jgi:hypothetical protein